MTDAPDIRRLLLVGPQPSLAFALAATGTRGLEIETCSGSAEALRHVRARAVDVVVTDPAMAMSEDLALALELQAQRPGLKVIAQQRGAVNQALGVNEFAGSQVRRFVSS